MNWKRFINELFYLNGNAAFKTIFKSISTEVWKKWIYCYFCFFFFRSNELKLKNEDKRLKIYVIRREGKACGTGLMKNDRQPTCSPATQPPSHPCSLISRRHRKSKKVANTFRASDLHPPAESPRWNVLYFSLSFYWRPYTRGKRTFKREVGLKRGRNVFYDVGDVTVSTGKRQVNNDVTDRRLHLFLLYSGGVEVSGTLTLYSVKLAFSLHIKSANNSSLKVNREKAVVLLKAETRRSLRWIPLKDLSKQSASVSLGNKNI